MLAAQCVCAILNTEHSVIRQTIRSLEELLRGGQWQEPGLPLARLRTLMEFQRSFESRCHGPKEHDHLLPLLKGRSLEIDRLMDSLVRAQQEDDALLDQAFALLDAVEKGDDSCADALKVALQRHGQDVLSRLAREDGELLVGARQHLASDEWADMASAMSRIDYPADALYQSELEDAPAPDHAHRSTEPSAAIDVGRLPEHWGLTAWAATAQRPSGAMLQERHDSARH